MPTKPLTRDLKPEELLTDSLYGSDDNTAQAKQEGVELVAPAMGVRKNDKLSLSDFEISKKDKIAACPNGK